MQFFASSCPSSRRVSKYKAQVANHPGRAPDPFYTFFGLAGRALLEDARGAAAVPMDPAFALPKAVSPSSL